MAKAGYDPREAPGFFERMMKASKSATPPEFLSTHPADQQRIRQHLRHGSGETTKTFAGNCEFVSIDGQQYAYTYLSS